MILTTDQIAAAVLSDMREVPEGNIPHAVKWGHVQQNLKFGEHGEQIWNDCDFARAYAQEFDGNRLTAWMFLAELRMKCFGVMRQHYLAEAVIAEDDTESFRIEEVISEKWMLKFHDKLFAITHQKPMKHIWDN